VDIWRGSSDAGAEPQTRRAELHSVRTTDGKGWNKGLFEQLHKQLHNFNSKTANSLLNSLVSFSENSLSQS
jgi:hypothetical protein